MSAVFLAERNVRHLFGVIPIPVKEHEVIEGTEHLVQNLAILAKALFGENLYLIPKASKQSDWTAQDIKIGDGLLWLLDSDQDRLLNILKCKLRAQYRKKIYKYKKIC